MFTVSVLLTLGLLVMALPEIIFISAALVAFIKEKKSKKTKSKTRKRPIGRFFYFFTYQ